MKTSELGLVVHLDAAPSEQLWKDSPLVLVLTALICDQDTDVENLKQFKDTQFSNRASEANRIQTYVANGALTLTRFIRMRKR